MAEAIRMLINATQTEEIRVAMVQGKVLENLEIEPKGRQQKKGGFYKGRVARVEPSLAAAFVEYGAERNGFLSLKEVHPDLYQREVPDGERMGIKQALRSGQELVVQVDKSERGTKGAALTTFLSLAGSFLVLMPNNDKGGGVSRRIGGTERAQLKTLLDQLTIPEGMSVIIRTASLGRPVTDLQWDLDMLLKQYEAIRQAASDNKAPCLLYSEGDVVLRSIRDSLWQDVKEILIDDHETYERAHAYLSRFRPDCLPRLKLYDDPTPMFTRFQIEHQIEVAFRREVQLSNGGSLVIDTCEALVAIDVNSAKATEGNDIEETALRTNLAAAKEVARQLRLRDIGGLIVIDFIDMSLPKHQRMVEETLEEAMAWDRARVQIGRISRFGLMEMSRQRLQPALEDYIQEQCPRCMGQGRIRNVPSLSLSLLRVLEEEAMKPDTAMIKLHVPIEVSAYLLNEKRMTIHALEKTLKCHFLILPNPHLDCPAYELERVRTETFKNMRAVPSFTLVKEMEAPSIKSSAIPNASPEVAAVSLLQETHPSAHTPQRGLIKRLWRTVFGDEKTDSASPAEAPDNPEENQLRSPTASTRRRSSPHNNPRDGQQRRNPRNNNTRSPKRDEESTNAPATTEGVALPSKTQVAAAPSSSETPTTQASDAQNEAPKRNNRRRRGGRRRSSGPREGTPDTTEQLEPSHAVVLVAETATAAVSSITSDQAEPVRALQAADTTPTQPTPLADPEEATGPTAEQEHNTGGERRRSRSRMYRRGNRRPRRTDQEGESTDRGAEAAPPTHEVPNNTAGHTPAVAAKVHEAPPSPQPTASSSPTPQQDAPKRRASRMPPPLSPMVTAPVKLQQVGIPKATSNNNEGNNTDP